VSEIWTTKKDDQKRLLAFEMRSWIQAVRWQDHRTDEKKQNSFMKRQDSD